MIRQFKENVKGIGNIIPKSITIDNQKQKIKTYEQISIDDRKISFDTKYEIEMDYVTDDGMGKLKPNWKSDIKYRAALAGAFGGAGGAVSNNSAVSRISVMDPHLLMMMRDVMDASDTAVRLNPQGQACGGGGGGGGSSTAGDSGADGGDGVDGSQVNNCIVGTTQSSGGNGGQGSTVGGNGPQAGLFPGGGGGGGAGGGGGVIVVCTTTAEGSFLSGNCDVTGGGGGDGGAASFGGGTAGANADDGKVGSKLWIQI